MRGRLGVKRHNRGRTVLRELLRSSVTESQVRKRAGREKTEDEEEGDKVEHEGGEEEG